MLQEVLHNKKATYLNGKTQGRNKAILRTKKRELKLKNCPGNQYKKVRSSED
jgi:hypothetical protein